MKHEVLVTEQRRSSKMLGLEIVRFSCALGVLIWHYQHFYQTYGALPFSRNVQPLYRFLTLFYEYGEFGVQIFWGISGFIFFFKYGEAIPRKLVNARNFFWLRFSRLYPLHFATLFLVTGLQPIHQAMTGTSFVYRDNGLTSFILQLGMATQWWTPTPYDFNGPIWSVSAEVLIYALFFFLVRKFGASAWMIGAVSISSIGAMMAGVSSPAIACGGFFFAGGAGAWLVRHNTKEDDLNGPRFVAAGVIFAIVGSAWWAGILGAEETLPVTLLLSLPPFLFLAAQNWKILERWETIIQSAGNLTYSIYLCHFPLQLIIALVAVSCRYSMPLESPFFLAAYLSGTLVAARLVYVQFERPTQDWIRSLVLRRDTSLLDQLPCIGGSCRKGRVAMGQTRTLN